MRATAPIRLVLGRRCSLSRRLSMLCPFLLSGYLPLPLSHLPSHIILSAFSSTLCNTKAHSKCDKLCLILLVDKRRLCQQSSCGSDAGVGTDAPWAGSVNVRQTTLNLSSLCTVASSESLALPAVYLRECAARCLVPVWMFQWTSKLLDHQHWQPPLCSQTPANNTIILAHPSRALM